MFSQKISSLQAKILELQQQQTKYQSLEQEATAVLGSIAKLHQAAAELNEQNEIEKMIASAIGYSLEAPQESAPQPEPEPETYEEIVERVTGEFKDECDLAKAFETDPPTEEILQERIRRATGTTTVETTATLIEDEVVEDVVEPEDFNDKYSTPKELKAALAIEDPETILMEIANILDAAPATDIQGMVWYFVQNLPIELCDRAISYLPKSIIPEWRKQMDVLAEEAKASIFPPTEQPPTTYEPAIDDIVECISNGLVGRVVHLNESPNGPMASVLLPGGTSNFHVSNLKYIGKFEGEKPEDAPKHASTEPTASNDDEIDQLAKQCLGLRSWSQIRIFADSNPAVIYRMQELASTKIEKRLIHNLPSLVLGYIQRASDRTDLEWLPENVLCEVEALLGQPQVTAIA